MNLWLLLCGLCESVWCLSLSSSFTHRHCLIAKDIVYTCPLGREMMGTGCHTEAAFIKLHPLTIICTLLLFLKCKSFSGGHSVNLNIEDKTKERILLCSCYVCSECEGLT